MRRLSFTRTIIGALALLSPLITLNPINTIQNVLQLENETTLGKAMIGLASVLAKGKESTGAKS